MSTSILSLEPKLIWKEFYALTQIPRPSGHTEAVANYLVKFAHDLGLESFIDDVGNVIMKKAATPGMENRKTVIMQAHMDMVSSERARFEHDFEKDPIETIIDGDWVKANGTTLGSDDGLGVAAIMAIMEEKDIKHGPLVALITRDEETGMFGAFGLKKGTIDGDILLNLDSEDEGMLFIGCAGGIDIIASLEYKEKEACKEGCVAYYVQLKGLRGGHSGLEINEGRANGNKLMVRFVYEAIAKLGAHLASWEGGNMRNAIPREAHVVLTVPEDKGEELVQLVAQYEKMFNEEFKGIEKDVTLRATKVDMPKTIVPEEIQDNLIDAIYACQDGVTRMIPSIPDTVETSSNLAIITIGGGKASVQILARSSNDEMKDYVAKSLIACFNMAGMKVETEGGYSGWQPDVNSPILAAMKKSYKAQFGTEAKVVVVHAGLECAVIGAVVDGLDMISFGPTLKSPHTPSEHCNIPSTKKFYEFLVATLAQTPVKE
jgi:dipeptidase D